MQTEVRTTRGGRIVLVVETRTNDTTAGALAGRLYLDGYEVVRLERGAEQSMMLQTSLPDYRSLCVPIHPPQILIGDLVPKRRASKIALEQQVALARSSSRTARAPARQPRHGFQQLARLPCYRGSRDR